MNIAVCVKQVPSSSEVHLDPRTNTIVRDGKQSVVNPFDYHALEEAVRLKEALGGAVTTISMGIPATQELLRDTMSRGADCACLLTDRAFAGADTLATSYTLSLGLRSLGHFDLILCGKMAIDGDTAQIGPELAEQLGIPHLTDVVEIINAGEKRLTCRRNCEGGFEIVEVALPALLTVVREINQPRLPSISGVRHGSSGEVKILDAKALAADKSRCGLNGSPTQVVSTFIPKKQREAVFIQGNAFQQAAALAHIIGGIADVRA